MWPAASRIVVYEPYPGTPVPVTCVQCDDYPCISACTFGALRVDENNGAVLVDGSKCTLCGACRAVCPVSAPRLVPGKPHVVVCDLCGGDPQCVKICNEVGYGALKLVSKPEGALTKTFLRDPYTTSKRIYERVVLGGSK